MLVRVHRIGVCGTDLHAFAGKQPFFTYPRVLGHELGVEVIDPGDAPGGLKAGDRCAVEPYLNCGRCIACRRGKPNCCTSLQVLGVHTDGGMRPLLRVPARKLHPSAKLGYEQLALIETLGIGAHAVDRAQLAEGEFVLVIGAGPIGLSVIQFALARGAMLAVMDVSDTRLEFCRKLGVPHVLKPGAAAVAALQELGGGDLPTCVIDATGNAASMAGCFNLPAHGGRIVFVGLFEVRSRSMTPTSTGANSRCWRAGMHCPARCTKSSGSSKAARSTRVRGSPTASNWPRRRKSFRGNRG